MPTEPPIPTTRTVADLIAEDRTRREEIIAWERDFKILHDGRPYDASSSPLIPVAEAKLTELRAAHAAFLAQCVIIHDGNADNA